MKCLRLGLYQLVLLHNNPKQWVALKTKHFIGLQDNGVSYLGMARMTVLLVLLWATQAASHSYLETQLGPDGLRWPCSKTWNWNWCWQWAELHVTHKLARASPHRRGVPRAKFRCTNTFKAQLVSWVLLSYGQSKSHTKRRTTVRGDYARCEYTEA